ncbi:hypothetical protein J6590_066091 [Homalodisca vitripennis]|nr:hypothetical protein J6590_066091 [Homalodisca vitripennis]
MLVQKRQLIFKMFPKRVAVSEPNLPLKKADAIGGSEGGNWDQSNAAASGSGPTQTRAT